MQSKKLAQSFMNKNVYRLFSKNFSTRKNYRFITDQDGKKIKIIDENPEAESAIHYDKEGKIEKISLKYLDKKNQKICILFLSPTGCLRTKCIQDEYQEYTERYQNGKCIQRLTAYPNNTIEINYFQPQNNKFDKTQYNISENGIFNLSNIAEHKPPYYDSTGFTIDPITHIELDSQGKPTNPAFTDIILFD
ncbi:MAG: hypothetical protein ACXWL5_00055 [Candidatus Chromulinivorax sp.]